MENLRLACYAIIGVIFPLFLRDLPKILKVIPAKERENSNINPYKRFMLISMSVLTLHISYVQASHPQESNIIYQKIAEAVVRKINSKTQHLPTDKIVVTSHDITDQPSRHLGNLLGNSDLVVPLSANGPSERLKDISEMVDRYNLDDPVRLELTYDLMGYVIQDYLGEKIANQTMDEIEARLAELMQSLEDQKVDWLGWLVAALLVALCAGGSYVASEKIDDMNPYSDQDGDGTINKRDSDWDSDNDGMPNTSDSDDDNDGISDDDDPFPTSGITPESEAGIPMFLPKPYEISSVPLSLQADFYFYQGQLMSVQYEFTNYKVGKQAVLTVLLF